ncbi:MAG: maltose alpha-D-glucosyltransferase [Deltaproteobacteria bacterium]|nr:maltose alpha-D-glucosyltransferase [Deltaproteobacteria bacterium]
MTPTPSEDLVSPKWYETAIIYELHVRAYCDSNNDGVGDFQGLTSKLDYLSDLGVTALWLLPFYPSPLRDGGYDIGDYENVNPVYGSLEDFRRFLDEAHKRDLRVITELVINHTSSDHAWFQRARRAPTGSPERDFYVWSDTADLYSDARIIFKDFETSNWTWDPVARAYYWHRFYSHQPDLNFDNLAVHEAVFKVVDMWLAMGVDGLRLDAIPYLFQREGTTCENLPETHGFLKKLRARVDAKFSDRMLLAEANQWPSDAAAYFGEGDECHMNFHFPLMPRLYMSVEMEDRFPIVDILRQTPKVPQGCQWATFLRNHDELSLEMVTDEERDYMYAVYTEEPIARINLGIRRRLAPLVRLRSKIELLNGLLFSLPGTPVIYYGDEIGMGDNVYLGDRDGVRTPMQWSADRNAGFSRANPQRLYLPVIIDPEYHFDAVNVEAQEGRSGTLLRWMKQLIDLRKSDDIFAIGALDFVQVDNPRVLAFVRSLGNRAVLVVLNLSRHTQHATIDLSAWAGRTPLEMFGRSAFPIVTERLYPLSFAPYQFYWFQLEAPAAASPTRPTLRARDGWMGVTADRAALSGALTRYARERRWFRGKAKPITGSSVVDVLRGDNALFTVLEVTYADGAERYMIPIGFATGERAVTMEQTSPFAIVASLALVQTDHDRGERETLGVVYDALATGEAATELLEIARAMSALSGERGQFVSTGKDAQLLIDRLTDRPPSPRGMELDQTNSTIPFGDRIIMKVFRQLETGVNSEIEIGESLTKLGEPRVAPAVLGSLAYTQGRGSAALAVIHEFVESHGTAWSLFMRNLEAFLETLLSNDLPEPEPPVADLFALREVEVPSIFHDFAGLQLWHARMLGERTALMHNALGEINQPEFSAERFTIPYQQSLYQSARGFLGRTFELLGKKRPELPEEVGSDVDRVLASQARVEVMLRSVSLRPMQGVRIRCHGDLHLGQVLFTGDDFVIIDFEGEPARPLRERRYKRCPLRDVAGMVRSFSYAAESLLRAGRLRERDRERLHPWAMAWTRYVSAAYLDGYTRMVDAALMPPERDASTLLAFYTADKCVYEIAYELNNRPAWLSIPISGLLELLDVADQGA